MLIGLLLVGLLLATNCYIIMFKSA